MKVFFSYPAVKVLLAFLLCPFWTLYAVLVLLPFTLWRGRRL